MGHAAIQPAVRWLGGAAIGAGNRETSRGPEQGEAHMAAEARSGLVQVPDHRWSTVPWPIARLTVRLEHMRDFWTQLVYGKRVDRFNGPGEAP
jgi:hypothetical protein